MRKKNKILIGGSNGYIGTRLCEHLKKKKYNFEGIDINLYQNCKLYRQKYKYKTKLLDVRDISDDYIKNFDVYIHLAGITNNPIDNYKNKGHIYNVTRNYTKEIALKCKKNNVRFIFASSCSVYGNATKRNLKENAICKPVSYYAQNKLDIERDLKKISDKNFKPIILRISTLFGFSPKMRFDLAVSMFILMAKTNNIIHLNSDGQSWRPHLHLNDLVKVFEKCIIFQNKKFEIINVGSNKNNFKILDVAIMISKLMKCKINFLNKFNKNKLIKDKTVNYGKDKRNYSVNFDKINKLFKTIKFSNLKKSIKEDILILNKLKLPKNILSNKKYFRLYYLSHLIKIKKIDSNLRLLK